jgi:hypothetical protein
MVLSMNYIIHRSDNDCLIPVVETSGSQVSVLKEPVVSSRESFPIPGMKSSRDARNEMNPGNDQAHFVRVKMPAMKRRGIGRKIGLNENRSKYD